MPDISADYQGIADTSHKMSQQCDIIVPAIYGLIGKVSNLLDNGLYLEQASPALNTAYTEFSKSLQQAASAIQVYANLLTQISDAFKTQDADMFAATLSSIDGKGGFETSAEEVHSDKPGVPDWNPPPGAGDTGSWSDDHTVYTPGISQSNNGGPQAVQP
ncbi:hypothetical protein O7599_05745 [Streptomyces sp. WMMC500]|uniref:hypothetical protein n=1 Tax=Streptomyces sp. WMMC500 TaxID=3015154 RepID=UPI00248A94FF|nr:hypothetical protein [Streptomyces sp. WMMC500]WBB62043.1 hypothetical protein O7599_05745 [Streptomyces sp. WMMC500]